MESGLGVRGVHMMNEHLQPETNSEASLSAEETNFQALLNDWETKASKSRKAHYDAAGVYDRYHFNISVLSLTLSAIVGTSIFATLKETVHLYTKCLLAVVSILATVIGGCQSYFRWAVRSEKHRSTASKYGSLLRSIEELKRFHPEDHDKRITALDKIRSRNDTISVDAPLIPGNIWKQVEKWHESISDSSK